MKTMRIPVLLLLVLAVFSSGCLVSKKDYILKEEEARNCTESLAGQVEEPDQMTPRMYLATPDLKVLGFVLYGSHKKTANAVARHTRETMKWVNKSRGDLKKAKGHAEAGRFRV